MSDPTLQDQIATVLRIEAELRGRWTVQKCRFNIWGGIQINSIMPDDPIHQMWFPFSRRNTYETSGEAVDEMQRMRAIAPDVSMRVSPAASDIDATYLFPRTGAEKQMYGETSITWGELRRRFPEPGEK